MRQLKYMNIHLYEKKKKNIKHIYKMETEQKLNCQKLYLTWM